MNKFSDSYVGFIPRKHVLINALQCNKIHENSQNHPKCKKSNKTNIQHLGDFIRFQGFKKQILVQIIGKICILSMRHNVTLAQKHW